MIEKKGGVRISACNQEQTARVTGPFFFEQLRRSCNMSIIADIGSVMESYNQFGPIPAEAANRAELVSLLANAAEGLEGEDKGYYIEDLIDVIPADWKPESGTVTIPPDGNEKPGKTAAKDAAFPDEKISVVVVSDKPPQERREDAAAIKDALAAEFAGSLEKTRKQAYAAADAAFAAIVGGRDVSGLAIPFHLLGADDGLTVSKYFLGKLADEVRQRLATAEKTGPVNQKPDAKPARRTAAKTAAKKPLKAAEGFFTVNRAELRAALMALYRITPKKCMLEVLHNVLIEVQDGVMRLTATDSELYMQIEIEGAGAGVFSLLANAKTFYEFVRGQKGGQIFMREDGGVLKASDNPGSGLVSFSGGHVSEFPPPADWTPAVSFRCDAGELMKNVGKVAYAMAEGDVRYYLNGILFEFRKDGLRFVAVDGHRMAISEISLDAVKLEKGGDDDAFIVGRDVIATFISGFKNDDGQLLVELSERYVRISGKKTVMEGRIIDGRFPDYEGVIPKLTKEHVPYRVNAVDFAAACHAAAKYLETTTKEYNSKVDKYNKTKSPDKPAKKYQDLSGAIVSFNSGCLEIEAERKETEEENGFDFEMSFSRSVPAESAGRHGLLFGVNMAYATDAFIEIGGDAVFYSADSNGPILVKDPDSAYRCVVMPMRI